MPTQFDLSHVFTDLISLQYRTAHSGAFPQSDHAHQELEFQQSPDFPRLHRTQLGHPACSERHSLDGVQPLGARAAVPHIHCLTSVLLTRHLTPHVAHSSRHGSSQPWYLAHCSEAVSLPQSARQDPNRNARRQKATDQPEVDKDAVDDSRLFLCHVHAIYCVVFNQKLPSSAVMEDARSSRSDQHFA